MALLRKGSFLAPLALLLVLLQIFLPAQWLQQVGWQALAATTLSFDPSSLSLTIGGAATVTVRVNDVVDLYGCELRLSFDPAVVEVTGLTNGSWPIPDFVLKDYNNTTGSISYAVTQLPPHGPLTGSGPMLLIHLRGKGNGSTTLQFVYYQLVNDKSLGIPATAGTCLIQVGTLTATPTATNTPTPTPSATPTFSATPEGTFTPTPTGTATLTPTPSLTPSPTLSPSPTATLPPGVTPSPTATPTASPTPSTHTFVGYVYEGGLGDTSRPLAGVEVQLRGSWVAGNPGTYLLRAVTNAQGRFELNYTGSFPHYSLVEIDPPGYVSVGAVAGMGGLVPDSSGNWVEFRDLAPGVHEGTMFFDRPQGEATLTPTPTVGTPSPTAVPPGVPIYTSRRADMDTYLELSNPNQNYGSIGHLHAGLGTSPLKTILVWFDLTDIPLGANVTEATLRLYGQDLTGGGTLPLTAFGLKRPWREMEATWRNARKDDPWAQPGALDTASDRDSTGVLNTFQEGGKAQSYAWDVRELVQAWLSGARPNYGWVIIPTGSRGFSTLGFYSSEFSLYGLRPSLAIVYTLPTPTPTATFTPTATPTETPTLTPTATSTPTPTPCRVFLPAILKPR